MILSIRHAKGVLFCLFFITFSISGNAQCYLQISSKFDQVVAIGQDSTLWTWGGAFGNQRTYVRPFQIDTTKSWKQVSTGENYAMALKSDGTIWAWGNNIYGQMGDGTTTRKWDPTKVSSDSNWIKVSCGKEFTVALKSNGTVWAWGRNDYGQLGQGTNRNTRTSPVQVGTDSNFIEISAGRYQTLLLKSDSTLWHFGAAYTTSISSQITQVGNTNDWAEMSGGSYECYAIKQDGTLWEFVNKNGRPSGLKQLGTDTNWDKVDNSNTYSPEFHALFIKTDGTLWSLGDNRFGQLGTGDLKDTIAPVQIGTANNWSQVVAGKHSSFGLKSDDTFWAWGRNNHAQFGNGLNKNSLLPINTSQKWKEISSSRGNISGHVLAINADGSLWSWGQNNNGQLGLGFQYFPQTLPVKVGTDTTWKSISTGFHFSLAIKKDGTLWGWGRNGKGQLALGSVLTSIIFPTQIGIDSNWLSVSAGLEFTIALKKEGTLWGWGFNFDGQLGNGSSGSSATEYAPIQIGNDSNWMAIATGDYHTIALKSDSTLWSWGANNKGQLGRTGSKLLPMIVDTNKKFIKIACGGRHTLALDSDSVLWACGYNNLSQLGDSTLSNKSTLTKIDSNSKWIKISGGDLHSVGVKSDSTLWAWGSNSSGQLGDSTSYVKYPPWLYVPTLISTTKWLDVSGGNYSTITINEVGYIYTMGDRYNNTFQNQYPLLGYTQTQPLFIDSCISCLPNAFRINDSICQNNSYLFAGLNLFTAGTYYDTLMNLSGCDSIVTLELEVNSIDDSISIIGNTFMSIDSVASYQWLDCNNAYSMLLNDTLQTYNPKVSGSYAVEITKNGCVDTSICQTVTLVGIDESSLLNSIELFPSPTSDNFQLKLPAFFNGSVSIIDVQGKVVETRLISGKRTEEFSLVPFKSGIYFVRIESKMESVILKVVKK